MMSEASRREGAQFSEVFYKDVKEVDNIFTSFSFS